MSFLLLRLKAQCVTANYELVKKPVGKPVTVTLGNLKIGIAGLVAKEDFLGENAKVARKYLKEVQIEEEVTKAKQLMEDFNSQGVTLIVLLSHLGLDRDQELAKAVNGIDVIIGGDSHTAVQGPTGDYLRVGDTYIVQAGSKGKYLGRLDLQFRFTAANAKLIELDQQITPDPEIVADLQAKKKEMEEGEYSKRVADVACELDGKREHVRTRETNLGNLVSDILKETYQADVAVFNGGAIRDSITQGPVTIGGVFKVLPFPNTAYTLDISGQDLLAMLQHSSQQGLEEKGGFLQVAGLSFVWEKGVGIRDVKVNEKPLDPNTTYKVVTSSFVADGGDGYTMLAKLPKEKRHEHYSLVGQTILEYLGNHYGKENKPISSPYCENGEPAKATRIIIEE
jgi:2',3'-cyclic-nucleotide 2'-phosphodiesterase (5'-nucleotidase family)